MKGLLFTKMKIYNELNDGENTDEIHCFLVYQNTVIDLVPASLNYCHPYYYIYRRTEKIILCFIPKNQLN